MINSHQPVHYPPISIENIENEIIIAPQPRPDLHNSVIFLSALYGVLCQVGDFYYYFTILAKHSPYPDIKIAVGISLSFWFLVNAIIGIQSSLYFLAYFLHFRHGHLYENIEIMERYRTPFVVAGCLIILLGIYWTVIGYVGFFKADVPVYLVLKLSAQTIIYVLVVGVSCSR